MKLNTRNIHDDITTCLCNPALDETIDYMSVDAGLAVCVLRCEYLHIMSRDLIKSRYLHLGVQDYSIYTAQTRVAEILAESIAALSVCKKIERATWRVVGRTWVLVPAEGESGVFEVGSCVEATTIEGKRQRINIMASVCIGDMVYGLPYNAFAEPHPWSYDVHPWMFVGAGRYLSDRISPEIYDYWRARMFEVNRGREREKWLDCELGSEVLPDVRPD